MSETMTIPAPAAAMTNIHLQELQPARQPSPATTSIRSLHNSTAEIEREPSIASHLTTTTVRPKSNLHRFFVVYQLCMINFLSSFTNGIIVIALPTIAASISLQKSLYLWPTSVWGLTSGATLLLAGSIADLVGARPVEILGCILLSAFTLACGFATTGIQLVIFRALQGVGMSMHLPASVSMVTAAVPQGRSRNISFGCLGLSQPLGFSAGLVVSGIMVDKVSWQSTFYLCGGGLILATIANIWALPKFVTQIPRDAQHSGQWKVVQILKEIDWIGGGLSAAGLAMLSYVIAVVSADLSSIHQASTIAQLVLSVVLLICFPFWMQRRERSGKVPLIPNALWKKTAFTSTCIMVALAYGAANAMELFASLYFQEIQGTSALFTSLRLLPNLLVGTLINLTVGLIVDKVSARWLVAISSMLCACSPLMMALVNPNWSYWYMEFFAQILAPISGDVLFTVGLLIVSAEFPEKTQALAGAVFSTVAQFGQSFGVTICQVVSLTTESDVQDGNGADKAALLKGYQARFWSMFAFMVLCTFLALGGLRKAGKVGEKRD